MPARRPAFLSTTREDRSYSLEGLVSVFVSGNYFLGVSVFVSVLVSVVSEAFFLEDFLVFFLEVFFLVPFAFDSDFISVDCVCVPVTGFVDDFASVFVFVSEVDVWAKRPTGRARTIPIARRRDMYFCMAFSPFDRAKCASSQRSKG
jgi:hypothetical protein